MLMISQQTSIIGHLFINLLNGNVKSGTKKQVYIFLCGAFNEVTIDKGIFRKSEREIHFLHLRHMT